MYVLLSDYYGIGPFSVKHPQRSAEEIIPSASNFCEGDLFLPLPWLFLFLGVAERGTYKQNTVPVSAKAEILSQNDTGRDIFSSLFMDKRTFFCPAACLYFLLQVRE